MGNQQSRSNVINETINKSLASVILNSSSNCGQNNNAIQQLSISNLKSNGCNLKIDGISQTSIQSPVFSCSIDSKNESDLLAKFKTELQQNAQSVVSGLAGAINSESVSEVSNKLVNDISNNININSVSNCVQDSYSKQTADINNLELNCPDYCNNPSLCAGLNPQLAMLLCDPSRCTNSITNINQNLIQKSVSECTLSNSNLQKVITDIGNEISQTAVSENKGIDLAEIISSIGLTVWLPFIIGGVVLLIVFILLN
jgi:hypothetical protein